MLRKNDLFASLRWKVLNAISDRPLHGADHGYEERTMMKQDVETVVNEYSGLPMEERITALEELINHFENEY